MSKFGYALVVIIFFLAGSLMDFRPIPYGFRWNRTDSLAYTLFFRTVADSERLERGSYVSFKHPLSQIRVAKIIVGLAHDSLVIRADEIYVNHILRGKIQKQSPSGSKLTPISTQVIPEGYVFVWSPHELSYDSRYEEFGLIPVHTIEDALWPLF